MKNAVIYMTFNPQELSNVMEEMQLLNMYATQNNLKTLDTISVPQGGSFEQILSNIHAKIKVPFEVILMSKKEIISSNLTDIMQFIEMLNEQNITLYTVEEGNINEVFLNLSQRALKKEREKISKRTYDTRLDYTLKGLYTGGTPPFGYVADSENKLVPDSGYIQAIQRAFEFYDEGLRLVNVSRFIGDVYGIKNERKGEAANTKTGNDNVRYMQTERLLYILSNDIYCGYPTFNRTEKNSKGHIVPASKEKWDIATEKIERLAIVDEELFNRVQKKLAQDSELPLKFYPVYGREEQ